MLAGRILGAVDALVLQDGEERLGHRVIIADSGTPDGMPDAVFLQRFRELLGRVVTAAISSLMLPSLVFGIDGPYASLIASITAESAPPGVSALVQLNRTIPIEANRLSHSSLYDDDVVISTIISHVDDFTGQSALWQAITSSQLAIGLTALDIVANYIGPDAC